MHTLYISFLHGGDMRTCLCALAQKVIYIYIYIIVSMWCWFRVTPVGHVWCRTTQATKLCPSFINGAGKSGYILPRANIFRRKMPVPKQYMLDTMMGHVIWQLLLALLTWHIVVQLIRRLGTCRWNLQVLQLIRRLGTCRWNLQVPNLQMSCRDLSLRMGTRIEVPVMVTRVTDPSLPTCYCQEFIPIFY